MADKKKGKAKGKTKKKPDPIDEKERRKKREIQGLIIIALGIFLAIAMFFNITGALGNVLSEFFKGLFGLVGYVLPFYFILYGALMLGKRTKILGTLSSIFFILLFFDLAIVNSVRFVESTAVIIPTEGLSYLYDTGIQLESGGVVGMILATLIVKFIGKAGAYILFLIIALVSVIVIADKPYADMEVWKKHREEREEEKTAKRSRRELPGPAEEESDMPGPEPVKKDPPPGYIPTDIHKTEKLIRKSGLSPNEQKILNYVNADMPLGKDSDDRVEGYGLSGEEESLTQPGYGLNEGYDTNEDRDEDIGYTGGYENYAEKDEPVPEPETESAAAAVTPVTKEDVEAAAIKKSDLNTKKAPKRYKFPPIDLLIKGERKGADLVDIAANTKILEDTLKAFNIDAKVVDALPGPAVTRYEIEPAVGVKVSSITNRTDDIALNLKAKSIRVEAPIPGKAAVGIEIENDKINMVRIREIIESKEFKQSVSKISFAVGKDIAGRAIVGDLKGMPHMLIAGSTGSGKSVCINSIIASILYKAKPDEVKLVLVDPKVVELGIYNGIPHLLVPVVTDPAKAAAALNWAVAEMNDRYKKFAEAGVRDLASYNEHIDKSGDGGEKMPQVVIIIDEMADLMMTAKKQVEDSICRLAQLARAAGMHLIVATQRPSVDIITGVIKANIPSRIAFAVSSRVDSQTILDMTGAEHLVGKGDMLYNPVGMGKPMRVQGTFISDEEVHALIEYVKSQCGEAEYNDEVISSIEKPEQQTVLDDADDGGDELMDDCIEFVVHSGQASVSMLQRRFRIGYNRAARIMDIMEERGIVGPADGARPRKVLITEEEISPAAEEDGEE